MRARHFALVLALVSVVMLLATAAVAHETDHGHGWADREDVTTEVKEVSDGIRITITSDNEEVARRIQQDASWYERFLSRGCGHRDRDGHHHMRHEHGHGW